MSAGVLLHAAADTGLEGVGLGFGMRVDLVVTPPLSPELQTSLRFGKEQHLLSPSKLEK